MGLAGITLLGVNRDGGSHILHSLFLRSGWALQTQPEVVWVPRGAPSGGTPLNYRWPPLGNCALLAPCTGMTTGYIWRDSPLWLGDDAMREGNQKRRGAKPLFLGTHLPSARCRLSPLLLEGSIREFSKQLFPFLANQEPLYEEALDWLQFAFTGDTKG